MKKINEYINKLEIYNKMVKNKEIKQDPLFLEQMTNKIYFVQKNLRNKND